MSKYSFLYRYFFRILKFFCQSAIHRKISTMLNKRITAKCPYFGVLLVWNVLGAVGSFAIAWTLISASTDIHHHMQGVVNPEDREALHCISSVAGSVGGISIVLGLLSFVWNVADIVTILLPCQSTRSLLGQYQDKLKTDLVQLKPILAEQTSFDECDPSFLNV